MHNSLLHEVITDYAHIANFIYSEYLASNYFLV